VDENALPGAPVDQYRGRSGRGGTWLPRRCCRRDSCPSRSITSRYSTVRWRCHRRPGVCQVGQRPRTGAGSRRAVLAWNWPRMEVSFRMDCRERKSRPRPAVAGGSAAARTGRAATRPRARPRHGQRGTMVPAGAGTGARECGKVKCAGGIRTRGLELMRLARTAAPLPRRSDCCVTGARLVAHRTLSTPLVHPSALDHVAVAACPTWRGVGARRSRHGNRVKTGVTVTYQEQVSTGYRWGGPFSLGRGLDVSQSLFKLSITCVCGRFGQ
jgi:hypothetical protein